MKADRGTLLRWPGLPAHLRRCALIRPVIRHYG
jgi:hypothetical protein